MYLYVPFEFVLENEISWKKRLCTWFWMRSLTRSMGAAAVLETMAAQPDRAKFSTNESSFPDIFYSVTKCSKKFWFLKISIFPLLKKSIVILYVSDIIFSDFGFVILTEGLTEKQRYISSRYQTQINLFTYFLVKMLLLNK